MNKENWKDIKGFEGLYQVSDLGNVKNVSTGRLLVPTSNGRDLVVDLYGGDLDGAGATTKHKAKRRKLHRLVGEHFIPNPQGLRYLIHTNGDKSKCAAENLYWSHYSKGD